MNGQRRRRGVTNLALALAQRELGPSLPPATVTRRFYENVVPSVPFSELSPPQDLIICRFTPCGQYLVAFNLVKGELVLLRFQGAQFSAVGDGGDALLSGAQSGSRQVMRVRRASSMQPNGSTGGASATARAAAAAAVTPAVQTAMPGSVVGMGPQSSSQAAAALQPPFVSPPSEAPSTDASPQLGTLREHEPGEQHQTPQQQQQVGQLQPPPAAEQQQAPAPAALPRRRSGPRGREGEGSGAESVPRLQFGDIFQPYARLQITSSGDEQLASDFALVVHGRLLIVASSSPEAALPHGDGAVPLAEATSLHLVDMEARKVVDRHVIGGDCVELSHHQGVHLLGDLLLVLGISTQTLYLLQVLPSGRLLPLQNLGQLCHDDDAMVIAAQRHAEQRWQQARQAQRAQQQQAAAAAAAGVQQAAQQQQQQLQQWQGAGAGGQSQAWAAAAAAAAGAGAGRQAGAAQPPLAPGPPQMALPAHEQQRRQGPAMEVAAAAAEASGVNSDSEEGEEREALGASPLIQGLKQRLLAHLFRQALEQCRALPAAAPPPALAAQQPPWQLGGGGRGPGLVGGAVAAAWEPGAASAGSQQPQQGWLSQPMQQHGQQQQWRMGQPGRPLQDRRPLHNFFYQFEPSLELVMWKAQFLDRRRLLIQWVSPDLLAGPQRPGPASPASLPHHHGAQLMVYNLESTRVEALWGASSQQMAEWYLPHAEELLCGQPASAWERYAVPAVASRAAREQQARDPQQYLRDLRGRLAEELPAACQQHQSSPYLDPNLYSYDDRFISLSLKGHHPPHRAVKFMCCCQPERLRFKLEPQDISHNLPGGYPVGGTYLWGNTTGSDTAARTLLACDISTSSFQLSKVMNLLWGLSPSKPANAYKRTAYNPQSPGGGRGGSRSGYQVAYLFHPFQPFLLTVVADMETGQPERVTAFARLA